MAVNTLTGYMLLTIEKPVEALEFINIAERIAYKLIEKNISNRESSGQEGQKQNQPNSLEVIGEDETNRAANQKKFLQEDSYGFTE